MDVDEPWQWKMNPSGNKCSWESGSYWWEEGLRQTGSGDVGGGAAEEEPDAHRRRKEVSD